MCMMHMMMDHGQHGGHDMQAQHSAAYQNSAPQQEPLLDILKRRCALGEIDLERFQEMQRVLGLSGTPGVREHGQR